MDDGITLPPRHYPNQRFCVGPIYLDMDSFHLIGTFAEGMMNKWLERHSQGLNSVFNPAIMVLLNSLIMERGIHAGYCNIYFYNDHYFIIETYIGEGTSIAVAEAPIFHEWLEQITDESSDYQKHVREVIANAIA